MSFSALLVLVSVAAAGTTSDAYEALEAEIVAPDAVTAGELFELEVYGELVGGSDFSVFSYGVYQDATWAYDGDHMVVVASGELVEGSGFEWGAVFEAVYEVEAEEGEHTYTFVMGYRDGAHGWYDLAVDVDVSTSADCAADSSAVDALLDALDAVSDGGLLAPAGVRRHALTRWIVVIQSMIDAGETERALFAVNGDLRRRVAGLGEPSWITDDSSREAVLAEINALSACLAAQL